MIKPKYRCSQGELYIIAKIAWISCKNFIHLFSKLSPIYTEAYIIARLNDIIQANRLPDVYARSTDHRILQIKLVQQLTIILNTLQILKRYIAKAFPADQFKAQCEAAGAKLYRKASNNGWEKIHQMLSSMITYIILNYDLLITKGGMPPTFLEEVQAIQNTFTTIHQNYLEARQESPSNRDIKIAANNLIHDDLIAMLADARTLPLSAAQKKQFTLKKLLNTISRPGLSGFKGRIINAETGEPIPYVEILIPSEFISAKTESDGTYEFIKLKSGKFTVTLKAPKYPDQQIEIKIHPGRISTLNFKMTQ